MEDMLGLSPRVPKFVREFGKIGAAIDGAIRAYAGEVRARTFPGTEHTYAMKSKSPAEPGSGPAKGSRKPKA
jgi:3-methyl-2-oxobutanoate hydroxymethyltransferase